MVAWWDHELVDRPVISYYFSKKRAAIGGYLDAFGDNWKLAKNIDIYQALSWIIWSSIVYLTFALFYKKAKKVELNWLKVKIY